MLMRNTALETNRPLPEAVLAFPILLRGLSRARGVELEAGPVLYQGMASAVPQRNGNQRLSPLGHL